VPKYRTTSGGLRANTRQAATPLREHPPTHTPQGKRARDSSGTRTWRRRNRNELARLSRRRPRGPHDDALLMHRQQRLRARGALRLTPPPTLLAPAPPPATHTPSAESFQRHAATAAAQPRARGNPRTCGGTPVHARTHTRRRTTRQVERGAQDSPCRAGTMRRTRGAQSSPQRTRAARKVWCRRPPSACRTQPGPRSNGGAQIHPKLNQSEVRTARRATGGGLRTRARSTSGGAVMHLSGVNVWIVYWGATSGTHYLSGDAAALARTSNGRRRQLSSVTRRASRGPLQ
jgi:hypothetical protein